MTNRDDGTAIGTPQRTSASSIFPFGNRPRRIETQIHRRKKAKPTYPLEAEWQEASPAPPHLRTSPTHMKRGSE